MPAVVAGPPVPDYRDEDPDERVAELATAIGDEVDLVARTIAPHLWP